MVKTRYEISGVKCNDCGRYLVYDRVDECFIYCKHGKSKDLVDGINLALYKIMYNCYKYRKSNNKRLRGEYYANLIFTIMLIIFEFVMIYMVLS